MRFGVPSSACTANGTFNVLFGLGFRVEHYGELAAECVNAYYKYGSALLEKAQAEADPLGNMPKKDGETQQESSNKNAAANGEPLAASAVSSDPERQGSSSGGQEGTESLKLWNSLLY